MRKLRGLVMGRFIPFHKGHSYLIEYAQNACDEVVVVLCSTTHDEIDAGHRLKWIHQTFPRVTLVHCDKEIPEAHRDNPDAPIIWAREIKKLLKLYQIGAIDNVFTSEAYGALFAASMSAQEVVVDVHRAIVPIAATSLRKHPFAHWTYLPDAVKRDLLQIVGIRGAMPYYERLVVQHKAMRYVATVPITNVPISNVAIADAQSAEFYDGMPMVYRAIASDQQTLEHGFVLVYLGDRVAQYREEWECSEILSVDDKANFNASSQELKKIADMNFVDLLNRTLKATKRH